MNSIESQESNNKQGGLKSCHNLMHSVKARIIAAWVGLWAACLVPTWYFAHKKIVDALDASAYEITHANMLALELSTTKKGWEFWFKPWSIKVWQNQISVKNLVIEQHVIKDWQNISEETPIIWNQSIITQAIERMWRKEDSVATIFSIAEETKNNECKFIRAVTNVKNPQGILQDGTRLAKNPACEELNKGKPFLWLIDVQWKPYYVEYKPIFDAYEDLVWALFVGIDHEKHVENLTNIEIKLRWIAWILTIFACLAWLFLINKILNPLKTLNTAIIWIENENITEEIQWKVMQIVKIQDDFSRIAESIITLIKQNEARKIDAATAEKQRCNLEKKGKSELLEIMANMDIAITSWTKPIEESAKDVEEVVEGLKKLIIKLSQAINEFTESTGQTSWALEEMNREVGTMLSWFLNMKDIIRRSVTDSRKGAENAENAAKMSVDLMHAIDHMRNSLKSITKIAKDTNLLALNATIEASRIWEAGKWFAVVADEMKKLAWQSQKSAEGIDKSLEIVDTAVQSVLKIMDAMVSIIIRTKDNLEKVDETVSSQTGTLDNIKFELSNCWNQVWNITKSANVVWQTTDEISNSTGILSMASSSVHKETKKLSENLLNLINEVRRKAKFS